MTGPLRPASGDAGSALADGVVAFAVANEAVAIEFDRAVRRLTELLASEPAGGGRVPTSAELQETIWHLRRLLSAAMGPGVAGDLGNALQFLSVHGPELERAVIVWVELIEVLVQESERRYGRAPGRGQLKRDEVREVVRRLLMAGKVPLPPAFVYLRPIVIDALAEMSVDLVVQVLNRHGAWIAENEGPQSPLSRVWIMMKRQLRRVWLGLTWVIAHVREAFRRRPVLSPRLRAAVEAVEREGLLAPAGDLQATVESALSWVVAHRTQLVAGVQLVLAAVEEAERFSELTGPEKREYAENLVMAVLSELGLIEPGGLLYLLLRSIVGVLIEVGVQLFNKRGVFPPPSQKPIV